MVGVYCTFLALDKRAMRRSENMAVLTVMPKQADLTEVMTLITAQLREVAKGITVMDFANATSAHIMSSADAVSVIGPDGKKENVPFKTTHPRVSGVQGDAVSQAVVASCRSQTSTQFCRCCFCNQGSVDKKTKVYDVRADLLLHNVGNVALTHTRSINHYRTDIDSRLADVGGYPFFFFLFFFSTCTRTDPYHPKGRLGLLESPRTQVQEGW